VSELELVGSWFATDASLSRIKRGFFWSIAPHNIPELVLKADGSFSTRDFPVLQGFTDAARPKGELVEGRGTWALTRFDERTLKLTLDFETGSIRPADLILLLDVGESTEGGLIVYYWIGDPDLFQLLEFHRTSDSDAAISQKKPGVSRLTKVDHD
jgi:hypothetical protein